MVKHLYALDETGQLILIDDASRKTKYFCSQPDCKNEMEVVKGHIKAHHFRHKHDQSGVATSHSPESVIHHDTILLLTDALNYLVSKGKPLNYVTQLVEKRMNLKDNELQDCVFDTDDDDYDNDFKYKILDGVAYAEKEQFIGKYKPDITLYDAQNTPVRCIEVVKSHDFYQDQDKVDFYKSMNLDVIRVYVKKFDDMQTIHKKFIEYKEGKLAQFPLFGLLTVNNKQCLEIMSLLDEFHDTLSEYKAISHDFDDLYKQTLALHKTVMEIKKQIFKLSSKYIDNKIVEPSFRIHSLIGNEVCSINLLCLSYFRGWITPAEWRWYYNWYFVYKVMRSELHKIDPYKMKLNARIMYCVETNRYFGLLAPVFTPLDVIDHIRIEEQKEIVAWVW